LAVSVAAGCESEQMVGSECPDGVCPVQESLNAPACLLGNTRSEIAISTLVPPELPPEASDTEAPWICLPRPLPRGEDGLVSCELILSLPTPAEAGPDDPESCEGLGYARSTGKTDAFGRVQCALDQLPVVDGELAGDGADGWYYDDFSQGVQTACPAGQQHRITATQEPTGGTLRLDCLSALANADTVAPQLALEADTVPVAPETCAAVEPAADLGLGASCTPRVRPERGFDDLEAYLEVGAPDCDGGGCLVYRLRDNEDFCDPEDPNAVCASPDEVRERIYCSCRCGAPEGEDVDPAELCDCADGYTCLEVLPLGPIGSGGSYCVRNGTFNR